MTISPLCLDTNFTSDSRPGIVGSLCYSSPESNSKYGDWWLIGNSKYGLLSPPSSNRQSSWIGGVNKRPRGLFVETKYSLQDGEVSDRRHKDRHNIGIDHHLYGVSSSSYLYPC